MVSLILSIVSLCCSVGILIYKIDWHCFFRKEKKYRNKEYPTAILDKGIEYTSKNNTQNSKNDGHGNTNKFTGISD